MAKMSEKQEPAKPKVCENFEPQAWRKTVCKNCFQAPENHMSGGGAQNDSNNVSHGKEKAKVQAAGTNENEQASPGSKPMTSSPEKAKSPQKSAASSLKDRYEQLERDKFKPKEAPKVAPKTKGPRGLSVMTDKNERLSGVSSAPVTPGTPEARMEKPNIPPPTQPKHGRMLDIRVSDRDCEDDVKSGKVLVNKLMKSKFGSVDNVSDTEETSKLQVFQKSRFGSMENISLNQNQKKKEPISIPIQKSKFGGSMDNISQSDKNQAGKHSQRNTENDLLSRLNNFSIEVRSGATSNVGSTVIHQKEGGHTDIISIPIKRTSAPSTPTTDHPKTWSNKESLQNELNEKRLSKGNDMFNKQNVNTNSDTMPPTSDHDSKSKDSKSDKTPLPTDKFKKLDINSATANKLELKSPTSEKSSKFDVKSPTTDTKPDFKAKFDKPDLKQSKVDNNIQDLHNNNGKVDLRAVLKKKSTTEDDSSKDKTEPKFPTLKSTKKDTPNDKSNDKVPTSSVSQDNSKLHKSDTVDNKKGDINHKTDDSKVKLTESLKEKSLKDDIKASDVSKNKTSTEEKTTDNTKLGDSDNIVLSKNKFELPKLKSSKPEDKESDSKGDTKSPENKVTKTDDEKHIHGKEDKILDQNKTESNKLFTLDNNKSGKEIGHKSENKTDSLKKDSIHEKIDTLSKTPKGSEKDSNEKFKPTNVDEKKPEKQDGHKQQNKTEDERTNDNKPAWLKHVKKDEKKSDENVKPVDKKPESKFKLGKKDDEPSELLSKFAKKDDPKPTLGKNDQKQDAKSKFGKQEEGKNELLSRFAKKDGLTHKPGTQDKLPDPKSKFGKQEENKPDYLARLGKKNETKPDEKLASKHDDKTSSLGKKAGEKSDILSKFAKKNESVNDSKPIFKLGKKDVTQEQKGKIGEQKTGKSELLSKFEKKTGVNVETKEKKDESKPLLKSKFGKQEEKTELKSTLGKLDNKKDKHDNQTQDSKFPKTDTNKPTWKARLEEKAAEKKVEEKNEVKSKFVKPELKSTKAEETTNQFKLKSVKQNEHDKNTDSEKKSEITDLKSSKTDDRLTTKGKESSSNKEATLNKEDTSNKEGKSNKLDKSIKEDKSDTKHPDSDFHLNKVSKNENSLSGSTTEDTSSKTENSKIDPPASLISARNFDGISTDGEAILGDDVDACALLTLDDRPPVHVDTQVFTSSRHETAGVIGPEEIDSFATASRLDISDLPSSRNRGESESVKKLHNGDISTHFETDIDISEISDKKETKTDSQTEVDLERLKSELKLMMERCSNLEKENEHLRHIMDKKDSEVRDVHKDKHDVETTFKSLQSKMQLMEEKCSNLEADNDDLSGKLKTQHEQHTAKSQSKDDSHDDKLTANEKYMSDIMEENETLKQEINDMKLEMDEMYDSFRDQEAEEFRELQRELEITAKNCRILQFKLRKMDRHSMQLEQDKNHFEEKLRMLQNQFQDRDAVSHIHALEDELRMAKDVSVRLHDELDLMEDKRGKMEEENRHLTELLEQADRKQFRLEMEVDKLRDKLVSLRQEMRQKEGPGGEQKVPLAVSGRQDSIEREMQQLKRALYDSREREADIRDQLHNLEGDNKTLTKKVTSLEEENDQLCKQLKKMSIERANVGSSKTDRNATRDGKSVHESDVELRVQFELAEKELTTVRRKLMDLEEENEMLHSEMFTMETILKEKDKQLTVKPEPSSPNAYYEDKIKEYEKEADEFRSKLLAKETEIQCLYSRLSSGQSKHDKVLRKAKSLDYETDYDLLVNLRRQVELGQQECLTLREKIDALEKDNALKTEELSAINSVPQCAGLSALAVAYIDSDNEAQLRRQLAEMKRASTRLFERIHHLSAKLTSLANIHYLAITTGKESISKIPKPFVSDEITGDADDKLVNTITTADSTEPCEANRKPPRDQCQSFTFSVVSPPNSCNYVSSDIPASGSENDSLSRDPYRLLSVIDDIFCAVLQRACTMDFPGDGNIVPPEIEKPARCNSPENPNSSDGNVSRDEFEQMMEHDICSTGVDDLREENKILELESTNSEVMETAYDTCEANVMDIVLIDADTQTDNNGVTNGKYSEKYGNKSETDIISYLEEEIDDLRLIINSKEEKNVALEEDVRALETTVKAAQDETRRREMELLNEMDLFHGKNEILSNLLDIVRERAETAEDELERALAELHEKGRESSDSSEKATPLGEISDGSDDVFDGSPAERAASLWEEQFKKRIRSLETLLAEERKKVAFLEKKLELSGSDVISSAMSDDAKLHQREKELLQSELQESQRHAVIANDQIRNLTDKLKKVETEKRQSPSIIRKPKTVSSSSSDEYEDAREKLEPFCKTCSELQSVKDQLCEELYLFKDKAEELEGKVDEVNALWVSKNAACEKEKHLLEQKLKQKFLDCKKTEEQLGKLREEDRMKDIFLKERDTNLKDKMAQITRKDELIQEQEEIIRQREDDMQQLFDQISQREKNIKELSEEISHRDEMLKEKETRLNELTSFIDEKNDEMHFMEEEMQDANTKRKESETLLQEMKDKLDETFKVGHSELETENERLQSDVDNLMMNITQMHNDKTTLQNELDKSKQALSEAMLMWDKDRSTLGSQLSITQEKLHTHEITARKTEPQAVQALRKEVQTIIETKEKIALHALLAKIEQENTVRVLKAEKFKLTEELTSKIRMLTHEMTNNDKMSDELSQLRGQDDINYQLHHHEKLLRAEYMAMKVRYETQLERLQREHMQLLEVVERLQREKNFDTEIISGIQRGMANIKETYTLDLTRWKGERNVLEDHIKQIEEGREIATHLRAQIDALRQQLSDQDMARTIIVNRMTSERQGWDIEKANLNSNINQLEEQLAVFVHAQSKSQDTQFRMEMVWEKERAEQNRLLAEAHSLAMDLQNQLRQRDEEHSREKKNLLEQLEKHRRQYDSEKTSKEKVSLEVSTSETRIAHLEQQLKDVREKHKREEEAWMKEKADLLRRLAEMRKTHLQDSRRIEDVLTALKRLRELAAIVSESDNAATLPSNGNGGAAATGDASAASASVTSGEEEMGDLKQNIDQIILKYVKESLQQLHVATEELAKPPVEVTREERQKIRRSLSSSEIDLLKDEFLIGPQDPSRLRNNGGQDSHVTSKTFHRTVSHDGNGAPSDHLPSDYIKNILMEQSTFYKDGKNSNVEVHRIKSRSETTRVETSVTSLPKPPPSFVIPRSRSSSPGPKLETKTKHTHPIIKSIAVDTSQHNRRSASSGTSADSSPVRIYPTFIPSSSGENGLLGAGNLQSGSLDKLSPNAARKRFFEQQPTTSSAYMSWPERHKKETNENRNSKSLSDAELCVTTRENGNAGPSGHIRSSVSMDESAMLTGLSDEGAIKTGSKDDSKSKSSEHVKSAAFRDMFKTLKKKFKPKIKRSHSAREHDRNHDRTETPSVAKASDKVQEEGDTGEECDEKHVVHERMTQIDIPADSDDSSSRDSRKDANSKKDRSRSPKSRGEKDDSQSSGSSTLQRLKKRFRSKSADRAEDRHVTPILVGHSSGSQTDNSWQYSETCV